MILRMRKAAVAVSLLAAVALVVLSGCGGAGGGGIASNPPSGSAGTGQLSVTAQTLAVVDTTGQSTGRSVTIAAATASAGNTLDLPISIDNQSGIAGLRLQLSFDKTVASCTDAVAGNVVTSASSGQLLKSIPSGSASALVAAAAPSPASRTGEGVLVHFKLQAVGSGSATVPVGLSGELYDSSGQVIGVIGTASTAGVVSTKSLLPGDLMGTGQPSVGSAIKILRVVVKLDAAPTDISQWDVNSNNAIDSGDATIILRCVVGLNPWPIVVVTTCNVTGTVVDQTTTTAVSGATATIAGVSATTSATGAFTITGAPRGVQTLTITATGYGSTNISLNLPVNTTYNAGTITVLYVGLPGTGAVTGTVYFADGVTHVAAGVLVFDNHGHSTTTNSSGYFRLVGVPVGPDRWINAAFYDNSGNQLNANKQVAILDQQTVSAGSLVGSNLPPPPPFETNP